MGWVGGWGGAVTLFTLVGVTLVAYLHDVKHEKLMFLLFQNSVMSDLMSNNLEISYGMCK